MRSLNLNTVQALASQELVLRATTGEWQKDPFCHMTDKVIRQRFDRIWRLEAGLLFSVFVVASLLLSFGLLADEVMEGGTAAFDRDVLLMFRVTGNPATPIGPAWLLEGARDLTSLGSFVILGVILTLAVFFLVLSGNHTAVWLLLVAVVGGAAVNSLLKIGFARPRPEFIAPALRVFTPSFPSGHASLSAATYLTLAALLARTAVSPGLRIFFIIAGILLTLAVGISRIYLGVHYPTDVFAGWCIGSAWALICWTIMRWMQHSGRAAPTEVSKLAKSANNGP